MWAARPARGRYCTAGGDMTLCALAVLAGVLAALAGSAGAECPAPCTCPNSTKQVMCVSSNLTVIPRSLPTQSITTLDMTDNRLHTIDASAFTPLRNLVNLKLAKNEIEVIHDGAFAPLQSLQTLDISGNRLNTLNERTFEGCAGRLLHLDVSANRLDDIDRALGGMTELSRLDLHDNLLTKITQYTFRDLSNLRYLLLGGNRINRIDRRAFRHLEKLMYLVLKGNPIGETVSKFQFNSYFLSYVDLSECGLKRLPRGLPNSIRYLQLRRNNMTVVHRHTFDDCPQVSILVLDENGITEINERTFDQMTYLQQLWLNSNKLTSIPHPLPPRLNRLLMDSNQVTHITDVFPALSSINTLSLMGNNISSVAHDSFYKLTNLTSLDLSNNQLQHIYGNTFLHSGMLRTLQLSKNPLRFYHSRAFAGLTSLQTLSLAYIHVNISMHDDVFSDLGALQKFDMDSSPAIVRTVLYKWDLLSALDSVRDLSLQNSDISTLRADFPDFFPKLDVLHLSSSRWHCDTALLWLRNWLLSTTVRVVNKNDLTCSTPHEIHGRAVTSLSDYEFVSATTPLFTTPLPTAGPLTTFPPQPPTPSTRLVPIAPSPTVPTRAPLPDGSGESSDTQGRGPSLDIYDVYEEGGDPPDATPRFKTWEEVMNNGEGTGSQVPKAGVTPTKLSDVERYGPSAIGSENLEINTLSHQQSSTPRSDAVVTGVYGGVGSDEVISGVSTMTIIIICTAIGTVIVAGILLIVIVYITKKQRARNQAKKGGEIYQNGIKYHHRNDVLYFMPQSGGGVEAAAGSGGGGGGGGEGSTSDSLHTTASQRDREAMSLIPGRDINHEGPLRVYKWEDF